MLDLFPNKSGIFFLLSLFSEHCKTATAKYCGTSIGGEDRGGLPDLDPDLSKSRGGHPESRDEKVGENRDISQFIPTYLAKKSGNVRIYPNSPRLLAQKAQKSGRPSQSRSPTHPDPILSGFYPPRDISPIAVGL